LAFSKEYIPPEKSIVAGNIGIHYSFWDCFHHPRNNFKLERDQDTALGDQFTICLLSGLAVSDWDASYCCCMA
jgi:hypothetical protein